MAGLVSYRGHKYRLLWKHPKGSNEKYPHGLKIMLVDGTHVRNHFDSDFCQGGNGYRYDFIPKDEIWIDEQISKVEWPFIIQHECQEVELMKKGKDYDSAHEIAKAKEDKMRGQNNES